MDLDPLTEAIIALARHDATCAECEETLPDSECEARTRLKATWSRVAWRRSVREDARRIAADAAFRGGQMTAEEPAR